MVPNLPTTFAEFAKEWNFDHDTSSPRNPRSNGQAEAAMKIVKGLLSKAKYSGKDPHLALLACRPTSAQHSHEGSTTRTPMLQMTMTDSTNVPPRVLNTTNVTAEPSPHCMQGKLYLSSTMTRASASLLRSFVKMTMAHTLYRL